MRETYLEWIEYRASDGLLYKTLTQRPMPGISGHLLNSVVYIYETKDAAEHGEPADGGTGFLVEVVFKSVPKKPAPPPPHARHGYVVTNAHNLDGKSELWVRFPTSAAPLLCIPAGSWIPHEDRNNDVIIAKLPDPLLGSFLDFDRIFMGEDSRVGYDPLENYRRGHSGVGPGNDVFMVSRFLKHDGGKQNHPAVRFGTIAMMPDKPIELGRTGRWQVSFLVEMHSIAGHSGSPVFVSRHPHNVIQHAPWEKEPHPDAEWVTDPLLLGIDCGHYDTDPKEALHKGEKVLVVQNTGMAIVLPAWTIAEVLNRPEVVEERNQREREWWDTIPDVSLD